MNRIRLIISLAAATAVLLACSTAVAATPSSGDWTGTTFVPYTLFGAQQTEKIATRFSVYRAADGSRRVKRFRFDSFKLFDCTPATAGPYGSSGFVSGAKPKIRSGAFKFTYRSGTTTRYKVLKVRGGFTTKKRATGTLTFTVYKPGASCTSHRVYWNAQLGSGGAPTGGK